MKRKDIEFSAEDMVSSVEQFARHVQGKEKLTLRSRVYVPRVHIKPMGARKIAALRRKLNVSQAVLADMLNVPTITVISWEKGRRKPTGAALRLLDIAAKYPEILKAA